VRVIARRMLTGLRNMHDADMAHRDLKPQNVAIRTEGDPESTVLIDYGAWLPVSARSRPAQWCKTCTLPPAAPQITLDERVERLRACLATRVCMHSPSVGVYDRFLMTLNPPRRGKAHQLLRHPGVRVPGGGPVQQGLRPEARGRLRRRRDPLPAADGQGAGVGRPRGGVSGRRFAGRLGVCASAEGEPSTRAALQT